MSSYIETVKQCFADLDMEKLRLVLKDYYYQDTTKDVFLEKMEGIFECHKDNGDTCLQIYKGKCRHTSCSNAGKSGYRFVGDVTRNYFDFIFEEEGDDIKEIYTCKEFSCSSDCGELDAHAHIYIQIDERISFERTLEYDIKLKAAMSALDELLGDTIREIGIERIQYWLDKHKETHERIGESDPFMPIYKWSAFTAMYEGFTDLLKLIDSAGIAFEKAYDEKPENDEDALIEWVIKHEELYDKIPTRIPISVYFENIYKGDAKVLQFNFTDTVIIKLYGFRDFFKKEQKALLEKYNSYTYEEEHQDYLKNHMQDSCLYLYELSFHINRRKELAKEGISIPLYLRNESCD